MRLGWIVVAFTCWWMGVAHATDPWADLKAYHARENGVSLLVQIDGETVVETYDNGGSALRGWNLASGTKTFSLLIAAAAVQDGLLDLDEPASATLTEWAGDARAAVTIREILSLTSGIETPPPGKATGLTYAKAVRSPLIVPPGESFAYGATPFQIFGEVMRRKLNAAWPGTYRDAGDYLQARILTPLGVAPTAWRRAGGYVQLGAGASMTARDWAVVGQFLLGEGAHEGRQLVDAATLAEARRGSDANPAYGVAVWLLQPLGDGVRGDPGPMRNELAVFGTLPTPSIPDDGYMAAGAGNQRLYIIPSRRLVVVRQQPIKLRNLGARSTYSDAVFLEHLDAGYRRLPE